MNYRWLAIVNPNAGAIRRGYLKRDFLEKLEDKVAAVAYTSAPKDAVAIAASSGGYNGLVAVGGDGTTSEILTGMDCANQRLAVIPAGTGNCLAVDLGLRTTRGALSAIGRGIPRKIDVMQAILHHADGSCTIRKLASTAGMGYATDVAMLAKKRFAGFRGYAYAAAAAFVRPHPREIRTVIDDEETTTARLTGLLINNTRCIGAARPFPEARIDDGLLNCFQFNAGWFRQCLHDLEMVTGMPVYGTPRARRLKTLQMHFSHSETVMLDGELFEQVTEMEISCQPGVLTCMEPAQC